MTEHSPGRKTNPPTPSKTLSVCTFNLEITATVFNAAYSLVHRGIGIGTA